ncbi:MAG: hypothetical protein WC699_07955 [Bacteroidales bacterium]|jgi:hypothetical protein
MKKESISLLLISILIACGPEGSEWKTDQFQMKLSPAGAITSLSDPAGGKNYLARNQPAPLMQLRIGDKYLSPSSCKVDQAGRLITLVFDTGHQAKISIEAKASHIVLKLNELTGADSADLIVWGPYPTTISETIGETVGVVRDSSYAIGIQSLNLKTLGGFPTEESDIEPSFDIFETNNLIDVSDSVKVIYRGQTARKEPFGSIIQAYCRNRNRERIISNWAHEYYVAPAFNDGGVTGSSIALFGCKAPDALKTIGDIELAEGLPHPVIDGEWGKTAKGATAAYLIMNFGVKELEDALALTKKAGLRYLYEEGPFETWGHFKLNPVMFPENWETMKLMVNRASEEGIRLGVHILSNFITTNDPYVTPVPDTRLARVGSSTISQSIGKEQQSITIKDPTFFNQMKNNTLRCVVIGNELIRYKEVSTTEPWILSGCERGAFGTTATEHQAGADIGKLMDHGYQTFLTNNDLSMEMSDCLANFFNFTGCRQISFDGLEGNWSTGMGEYGRQRFTQNWYDQLRPDLKGQVITDASGPGHYFWHMYTRMNWGEPWYAGFRESQTQYRLLNQLYFQRNLMPAMLGWFRMTPETTLEDIEWLLARSAGFDAGYALVTSLASVGKNGFSEKILLAIREWERARMAGAFPREVKSRMKNIKNEYHLELDGPNNWNLYPYAIWRADYLPGTVPVILDIDNENPDQPVQFILSSGPENSIMGISLIMDGAQRVRVPLELPANHHIKYTGGSYVYLYDSTWHEVGKGQLTQYDLTISQGKHKIGFEAIFTSSGPKQGIKIEMKTAGLPYHL